MTDFNQKTHDTDVGSHGGQSRQMMEVFENQEFGSIRLLQEAGKTFFCASDVAKALGYVNPYAAVKRHCRGPLTKREGVVQKVNQYGDAGEQVVEISFITEGDVYRLIVHSKLPSAERFEHWVFDEVLPSIRKHGVYMSDSILDQVIQHPEVIYTLAQELVAEREQLEGIRKQLDAAQPKADYHLHAMVLPVVEKEILWSKRCKDPELRGTVKEVVNQISHSKKWKSDIPLVDEKGNPLLRKNGKPMFRASYSILQDELFNHMTEKGFKGFQRGEYGSTAEHLTSLQYQIKQDTQRLDKLQQRIQKEQVKYKSSHQIFKTYNEIDSMGQKTFTGKMAISKEDYKELTILAKEGITSRAEIRKLEEDVGYYQQRYYNTANALENMKSRYNELKEKCRPFLQALDHFPEVAKLFTEKVKQLFSFKEAQERAEKEAREKERQERIKARRKKRGMER